MDQTEKISQIIKNQSEFIACIVIKEKHIKQKKQIMLKLNKNSKRIDEQKRIREIVTYSTIFHRNIPGFIIQGGDPTVFYEQVKGGECIYGKYFEDEIVPEIIHDRREIVSMANAGKDSNQSKFYITYSKQNHLNGLYTAFYQVISGWEALDLMEKETGDNNYKPLNEIKTFKKAIHTNPIAEIEQF
ncbi:unnamed protein product (macronuclear) [Paramecium tetraurelia]|uniref:Peptidyl-prolyl cis-trans isomerase n=1 Tax=Paramecium tetraurelia TaxID=5888 RepID=A0DS98_PARTE|nr:uncharacterized protein GSPATT00019619001 [Paramecium tetraurelia]CAK85915.1 unnamed protein product [Paramecium tetraurelia]|eukprot:XP_001453312.1 hypothetical protein (macronuclear) [Paramecium tetraurelia strain d4-2]